MTKFLVLVTAAVIAAGVFVIDPEVFTGSDFEATDMRGAIEGTWTMSSTEHSGVQRRFVIRQAAGFEQQAERTSLVRSAHACGDRTFVRSAHACMHETTMPLEISILGEGEGASGSGRFIVLGRVFDQGDVEISLGATRDHAATGFVAEITADGRVLRATTRGKPIELKRDQPSFIASAR